MQCCRDLRARCNVNYQFTRGANMADAGDHFVDPSGGVPHGPQTFGGNNRWNTQPRLSVAMVPPSGTIIQLDGQLVAASAGTQNTTWMGGEYRSTSTMMRWSAYLNDDTSCSRTFAYWYIWDYQADPDGAPPVWLDIFDSTDWDCFTNRSNEGRFRVMEKGFFRLESGKCGEYKTIEGTVSGYEIAADVNIYADLVSVAGPVTGPITTSIVPGAPAVFGLTGIWWTVPEQNISFELFYENRAKAKQVRENFIRWPADAITRITEISPGVKKLGGGRPLFCFTAEFTGETTPVTVEFRHRHNFESGKRPTP